MARELGINEGTLGDWVAKQWRAAQGRAGGALSEDERAELVRLCRENAELQMQVMYSSARSPAGWQRRWPVAVAKFIAAQRAEHGISVAVSCRALGLSPAWFYKWRDGDPSLRRARRRALGDLVEGLFPGITAVTAAR